MHRLIGPLFAASVLFLTGCSLTGSSEPPTPPLVIVQTSSAGASDTLMFRVVNGTSQEVTFNSCASTTAQVLTGDRWVTVSIGSPALECAAIASTLRGVGAEASERFILDGSASPGWYRLIVRVRVGGADSVKAVSNPFRIQ
jgi:hypothetical protein